MALLQVNFMSKSLMRTVPMQVILPVDKVTMPGMPVREDRPFKTLYLLHGLFGNYTDWVTNTRIQKWAEEKNLAVVMPSGDNSFYLDRPEPWNNYGEFVGQEIVEVTRKMFNLSPEREDTYIAGLSMGGFGAIRNGLKYHQTFGYIAGLSSAVHILEDVENIPPTRSIAYEESLFGPLKEAVLTDKNPRVIVNYIIEAMKTDPGVRFPKLFLACGTDDGLIGVNRVYRDLFRESGIELLYIEQPGAHDWAFWDEMIQKVLQWLPLEGAVSSVTSGSTKG